MKLKESYVVSAQIIHFKHCKQKKTDYLIYTYSLLLCLSLSVHEVGPLSHLLFCALGLESCS